MIEIPDRIKTEYDVIGPMEDRENVICLKKKDSEKCFILKMFPGEMGKLLNELRRLSPAGVPVIRKIITEYADQKNGTKGLLYVIEDEVDGDRLDRYIVKHRNELNEAWVYHFLNHVTSILTVLHTASPPLIHRDIKPENIMIGEHGEVWLLDFNISRFYENKAAGDRTNRDTWIMGTAGYAAPEQYGFMESDARSDIYSLGATLKYILDQTGIESTELYSVAEKCRQFNPAERYQSVAELRKALGRRVSAPVPEDETKPEIWPDKGLFVGCNGGGMYGNRYYSFLPPGFRRGSLWRMFFAFFVYYLLIYAVIHYEPNMKEMPVKYQNMDLWLNRIGLSITIVIGVLFDCNYRNIWNIYPMLRDSSKEKRILQILLIDLAVFILLVTIVASVESVWKK